VSRGPSQGLRRVGGPTHPPGERGTAMANSDDQAGSNRPNVVFILVDNVGWGDIGCYGGVVPTPRIDALAGQGVRFKNYNVEAQCTPTRSAILSGRLPIRTCGTPWRRGRSSLPTRMVGGGGTSSPIVTLPPTLAHVACTVRTSPDTPSREHIYIYIDRAPSQISRPGTITTCGITHVLECSSIVIALRPMKRPALFTTRTTAARRTTTRDASSISQARHDRQRGNDEGLPRAGSLERSLPPAAVRQGNVQLITGCIGEIGMACEEDHVRCRSPTRTRLQGARAGCPSATYWC
jgi:Sulfatase